MPSVFHRLSLHTFQGRLARLSAGLAILLIAGCAQIPRATAPNDPEIAVWAGRLSLQVQSEPPQAFFAGFELKGNAGTGELTLTNPLGSKLAVLRWSPQEALLDSGNRVQRFASVEELIETATGTAVPLPALFDWLSGKNTQAAGWSADLRQQDQGRLSASRSSPEPRVELRLVFAAP